MPIIRDLADLPADARGGAVAIGNFDGVHLGHLRIVQRLLEKAREVGGPAIVFTFDPHPVRLLRPEECPPPLTWTERKAQLLAAHGVYKIVAYPTDEALLRLSAQAFFDTIVRDALGARAMVEGPNFFFGHNREGNVERLAELTAAADMTLDVVEPITLAEAAPDFPSEAGQLVSSSLIRRLIAQGEVAQAAALLSTPYRIRGMVTHGAGRGAKLGFPTANLEAVDTLLPKQGVYAGRGWLNGESHPAAIHIGPNPTFGEGHLKVEVHLVDHDQTLYGLPLEVEFLGRLRGIEKFDDRQALVQQLQRDVARSRAVALERPAAEK